MYFALPLEKRDVHVCSFEAIWSGNWAAAYFRYIYKAIYKLKDISSSNFLQFISLVQLYYLESHRIFTIEIKEAIL